ncbi:hypothetical protein O0L34_g5958 [Tuta absoluta]|nr:hypothetical protein O0L34_g5958 [Tuta absoluta]
MKKNLKIPTNAELYRKRTLYHEKKDPIWVTLENEMRANAAKGIKPYNKKVGDWLKFMKELLHHYYTTDKRNYKKMKKEIGAPWYIEYSLHQLDVLRRLRFLIHQDVFEQVPNRTRKALFDLGLTIDFPKEMIMQAMTLSDDDPGIFFWELYKLYYKKSPSELLPRYDSNAQRLMSALVFVDLEECRKELIKITAKKPAPPVQPPKKKKTYIEPKVKFGEYLQKMSAPCYSNQPVPKPKKPLLIKNRIKMRTAESYEKLMKQDDFLSLRKERNMNDEIKPRICKYKFWKPPSSLRNKDPGMAGFLFKMKMFTSKPKKGFLKCKPPIDILHNHIKGVSYMPTGRPVYYLDNMVYQNTGYIPIHGGIVIINDQCITNILGYFICPSDTNKKCHEKCDCVAKWERVKEHLQLEMTKCKCYHLYDWGTNEGKPKSCPKYFSPPKGLTPFCVDEPKVYQMDKLEDFIKHGVKKALESTESEDTSGSESISPGKLKARELLASFLAELSNKPLIIPHLPKADNIKILQELVRQRVKGNLKKRTHKNLLLKSERKWINLDHIDHKTRAYMIPFTKKQLENLNFSHRPRIEKLREKMLRNYTKRTRELWIEHTRIFWNTMEYQKYPNKSFLDCFLTYMPVRDMDIHVFNPFSPEFTPKYGAKTCRLSY